MRWFYFFPIHINTVTHGLERIETKSHRNNYIPEVIWGLRFFNCKQGREISYKKIEILKGN